MYPSRTHLPGRAFSRCPGPSDIPRRPGAAGTPTESCNERQTKKSKWQGRSLVDGVYHVSSNAGTQFAFTLFRRYFNARIGFSLETLTETGSECLVFAKPNGTRKRFWRVSRASWASAWESLKKAAGLPGFRFHDLRHTHITHAVESGVPIEVIMAQVGHLSAEMTRYYTHLGTNAKHAAVAAVQQMGSAALEVLQIQSPAAKGETEAVRTAVTVQQRSAGR